MFARLDQEFNQLAFEQTRRRIVSCLSNELCAFLGFHTAAFS
jgi:hypothetical protein